MTATALATGQSRLLKNSSQRTLPIINVSDPPKRDGSETLMIGKVLWEEFFNNRDWPVASAVAVILLLILIIPIILFQRNEQKQREEEG